jgi:hypothetical protein
MLRLIIDRIAERFATQCASRSRRVVRERTDELVLELLGALRSASLAEIVEATDTLERRRKSRLSAARSSAARATPIADAAPGARAEAESASRQPASSSRDPFDITKPGELLDPVIAEASSNAPPPDSARQVRSETNGQGGSDHAGASPEGTNGTAAPSDARSLDEQNGKLLPKFALRDGEQLVRSGGSGVVIRRARGA